MAITNTEFDSGWQTVFDGAGISKILTGRELIGRIDFTTGSGVGTVAAEVYMGGLWTPVASYTADQGLTTFIGPLVRPRQFRFNCAPFTSGTITVYWNA